jgi:NAD(P)-dependent dehydrogenase (short-subunit alcohol dehydrogenase family)
MKIQSKVIVLTGAGSGIGRELALHLLSKGARVAGIDVNPAALEETSGYAGQWKDQFEGFVVNVAEKSAVEALPKDVLARFGAVDCVINNAGIIQPFTRLNNLDYSIIERVFNVNLFGTLFMIKAFLPHLLRRPEAHVVNLSSMGGFLAVPGQTIYCAAKAAVKLMSEGLASELLGTSVHVTVVFPGAVATNIRGNSGAGMPNEGESSGAIKALSPKRAAQIIVNGIERNARHLFVGKDAMLMDKLYRLSPDFAARTIAKKMRTLLSA